MYQHVTTITRKTNKSIWCEGDYYDIGCSAITHEIKYTIQYTKDKCNHKKYLGPRDIRMILAAVPFQMGTSIFSWVPSGPDTVISCKINNIFSSLMKQLNMRRRQYRPLFSM